MMVKTKIVTFVVNHWKELLILLLALIVFGKMKHDYRLMQKTYKTQIESARSQIEGLKEIHKQEIREKQLLMEEHLESMANIEEDYEKALEMIENIREDKKGKYTNKFNQDREELIKDIETKFGIQYAP
jgi:hypothetical protein|tara:strand:- start:92 stop:478 length:387 start_codon:yes stop_codon:yes gene_type:complete